MRYGPYAVELNDTHPAKDAVHSAVSAEPANLRCNISLTRVSQSGLKGATTIGTHGIQISCISCHF